MNQYKRHTNLVSDSIRLETKESPTNFVGLQLDKDGGAYRDRTDDLVLAKHALSQLS